MAILWIVGSGFRGFQVQGSVRGSGFGSGF
jgi:hypothetical protein